MSYNAFMNDEDFMKLAIESAKKAESDGGVLREECKALLKEYKGWKKS